MMHKRRKPLEAEVTTPPMLQSRPHLRMGSGDSRPPVLRPGSEDAARLPSVRGRWRYWPDGRKEPV